MNGNNKTEQAIWNAIEKISEMSDKINPRIWPHLLAVIPASEIEQALEIIHFNNLLEEVMWCEMCQGKQVKKQGPCETCNSYEPAPEDLDQG